MRTSRPVRLSLDVALDVTAEDVGTMILDLEQWKTFPGWGPLPGIESAEFVDGHVLEGVVGTRVAVRSTDGSTYVEEIVEWDLPRAIGIRMSEFSPPLNRFATHFDESWQFTQETHERDVRATRAFALYPRAWWARPVLWIIRPMLKAALRRQMKLMSENTKQ